MIETSDLPMNSAEEHLTTLRPNANFETEQQSALYHSRRVTILKKLMIMGCFLVFSCVVALIYYFNYLTGIDLDSISISSGGLVMTSPVLTGGDDTTKYEITAEKAIQNLSDPDTISLNKITAVVNNAENESYRLNSDKGAFNAKDDKLKLTDNVKVRSSNNFTAYSKSADIDLANDRFETGEHVYIYSETATLEAQKAIYDKGNLKFVGGVKVYIQPNVTSENQ